MEDFAFSHPRGAQRQPAARHAARCSGRSTASIPTTSCRVSSGLPEWPAINSEIFMHTVVPNLKRLGLITERTEDQYRRIGVVYGDRFEPQEVPLGN